MTDTFARAWTYRTPLVTATYAEGWTGELPKERQIAARKAGVLVPPQPETRDGDQRIAAPRKARRARQAEG